MVLSNNITQIREGLKKNKKMVGFIQRSSGPSQTGIGMDKKNSKIPQFFLCLYYLYNHQIWREL